MNSAIKDIALETSGEQRDPADEQLVVFNLGSESFGIDISRVEEIIRWQRITAVPKAPYAVEGIIDLRGRIVPVVDLRRCFGLAVAEQARETRIVVVGIGGATVGLIVDGVSEVMHVSGSAIEPPSPVITTVNSAFMRGIVRLESRLIILLDLEKVMAGNRSARLPEGLEGQLVAAT
jgi:purine-binding chemotaxis protein CheW